MLQVQWLGIFLLPSPICCFEFVPVHEDFSAIVVPLKIIFPADGALFSAIGTLWQKFIFQYQRVLLVI